MEVAAVIMVASAGVLAVVVDSSDNESGCGNGGIN